jgi:hypothetical protein
MFNIMYERILWAYSFYHITFQIFVTPSISSFVECQKSLKVEKEKESFEM